MADRTGVQRLTVYRHFPADTQLFHACSSLWLQLNPPPRIVRWEQENDAARRTQRALEAFFGYYRKTQNMWSLVYRDEKEVAAMEEPLEKFHAYLDEVRDDLLGVWNPTSTSQKRNLKFTLGHCLQFATWQSFNRDGLSDKQMINLAGKWIAGITA